MLREGAAFGVWGGAFSVLELRVRRRLYTKEITNPQRVHNVVYLHVGHIKGTKCNEGVGSAWDVERQKLQSTPAGFGSVARFGVEEFGAW